jgi:hypothetical protein
MRFLRQHILPTKRGRRMCQAQRGPHNVKNYPGDVGAHGVRPCGKKVFANKSGIASRKKTMQTGLGQMKTANPLGNISNQTKSSPIDKPAGAYHALFAPGEFGWMCASFLTRSGMGLRRNPLPAPVHLQPTVMFIQIRRGAWRAPADFRKRSGCLFFGVLRNGWNDSISGSIIEYLTP